MRATANIATLTLVLTAIPSWCLQYQDIGGNPPHIVSAQEEMFFTTVNDDGSGAPQKQEFGIVRNLIQMNEASAGKPSFESSNKKPSISSSEADEIPYYYTELVNEAPWYRLKSSNVSRRNASRESNFGLRSTYEEQPLRGFNKHYHPYSNKFTAIGRFIGTNGSHQFNPSEFPNARDLQPIRSSADFGDGLYYPSGNDRLISEQGDAFERTNGKSLSDLMKFAPSSDARYREELPKPLVEKWMSYKINMDNMKASRISEKEKFINKLVHDNVNKFQSLVRKAVVHEQKDRSLWHPLSNYMDERQR